MAGLVEIEGVSFATDANTVFQREQQGEDDLDISAAEFFASASVGSLVKAKDRDDDGTAEEIELELRVSPPACRWSCAPPNCAGRVPCRAS